MGFRQRLQPAVKTPADGPQLESLAVAVQFGEHQRGFGFAFCNCEYKLGIPCRRTDLAASDPGKGCLAVQCRGEHAFFNIGALQGTQVNHEFAAVFIDRLKPHSPLRINRLIIKNEIIVPGNPPVRPHHKTAEIQLRR
ncbi:hypothetical protein D3C76_539410 [compost metagenome]